jgi:3-oxoacyl-[acyl-carrier-protein] synthase-3/beta-ketoacyl ACP synthase
VGAYRPARHVTNDEVVGPIGSSDEWIRRRSGIRARHFAAADESIVSMAAAASRTALASAGVSAAQIDVVVVATSTHNVHTPAAAPTVASALGMTGTAAFDISAGCAGFCHGLAVASDLVRGGTAGYALLVGVEKLTDAIDPTDRATAFLFGDGAGAVVIGPSTTPGIGPTVWGSDGAQHDAICQTKTWADYVREVDEHGSNAVRPYITMQGTAVFRWASHSLEKVCREALDRAGVATDDLDALIPHQANGRIIEIMARVLNVPEKCAVAMDIETSGNTSAASIPLAMQALLRDHKAVAGKVALLVAFGAGLSYAAQVVRLPALSGDAAWLDIPGS